jgi:hypothetical protein
LPSSSARWFDVFLHILVSLKCISSTAEFGNPHHRLTDKRQFDGAFPGLVSCRFAKAVFEPIDPGAVMPMLSLARPGKDPHSPAA